MRTRHASATAFHRTAPALELDLESDNAIPASASQPRMRRVSRLGLASARPAITLAALAVADRRRANLADEQALARELRADRAARRAEELCGYGEPFIPTDIDSCSARRPSRCAGRGIAPTS